MKRLLLITVSFAFLKSAFAFDDAEVLAARVPGQNYWSSGDYAVLDNEKVRWVIPLWSCTPHSLKIIKVLGTSPPAPYAIEITVAPNERIDGYPDTVMRLSSVHLLAASLEDAVKMRRALITEIDAVRRIIEKRQGNRPGYLKHVVESKKH